MLSPAGDDTTNTSSALFAALRFAKQMAHTMTRMQHSSAPTPITMYNQSMLSAPGVGPDVILSPVDEAVPVEEGVSSRNAVLLSSTTLVALLLAVLSFGVELSLVADVALIDTVLVGATAVVVVVVAGGDGVGTGVGDGVGTGVGNGVGASVGTGVGSLYTQN